MYVNTISTRVLGSIYPYIDTKKNPKLHIGVILIMVCLYSDIIFMTIAHVRYIYFNESSIYFDIWFPGSNDSLERNKQSNNGYVTIA